MPRIAYEARAFKPASIDTIARAIHILDEYDEQGFDLTLRQLYYQFVARGWIANKQSEYKRLGSIVNDARMAGHIDWDRIVDRTRNLRSLATWDTPQDIIESSANQYRIDRWADQPAYVEVWIEKDALVGVIAGVCDRHQIPYFSCRGYASQSEMWSASQRLGEKAADGKAVRILHLGDHDPSGIDMSRDIRDRLGLFMATDHYHREGGEQEDVWAWLHDAFTVDRIALTMDQVDEFDPPPNPAKMTDSRATDYVERFGYQSWELDALDPTTLAALIDDGIADVLDTTRWAAATARQERGRTELRTVVERWADIIADD